MTKAQEKQKAALLARLVDIYSGATGGRWCEDECLTLQDAGRVVDTIRSTFGERNVHWWVYRVSSISKFETPQEACDFLFENGVRANKRLEPSND